MKPNLKLSTMRIFIGACVFLFVCGSGLLALNLKNPSSVSVFHNGMALTGSFEPQVVDGITGEPIAGATLVIVETGDTYTTDENGYTPKIEVPIYLDDRFDAVEKKPWGEISLVVYKNGYVPYALFYLQIMSDTTRKGPQILMFQKGDTELDEPISIIEGPSKMWVDAIIEKCRPDNENG